MDWWKNFIFNIKNQIRDSKEFKETVNSGLFCFANCIKCVIITLCMPIEKWRDYKGTGGKENVIDFLFIMDYF